MESLVGRRERVGNYYSVKNGKVVQDLGKERPEVMDGISERVNKNGVTVYEIVNDFIAGKIIALELQDPPEEHPDYKSQMMITIEGQSGNKAIVRVPFDSAYGRGFLLSAEGIDFNNEVELEPYKYLDKKTGKDKMGLSVYQNGAQLPWTMGTKANPGDVPKLIETTFKGKKVWDNTEQLNYFYKFYAELSEKVSPLQNADEETEDDIDF